MEKPQKGCPNCKRLCAALGLRVLVDGELSLVGTVNLDMRSLWLNFEITLAIDDKGFGADLAAVQDDYISRSRLLDARLWLKRPLWQRVAERLFYFFSPLL